MYETILITLIVVAAVVAFLIIVIAMRPTEFNIERSARIAAAPADVFAQVNDLHKWEAWSPWAKIDPAMKQSYEGASEGPGAIHTWNGNNHVGEGRMTITESVPSETIKIKLEFMRPFKASNDVEFTFKPDGAQTVVTWTMSGKYNFVSKAFGLFMNMDKMIGGMYEQGLAQMKSVVETKKVDQ